MCGGGIQARSGSPARVPACVHEEVIRVKQEKSLLIGLGIAGVMIALVIGTAMGSKARRDAQKEKAQGENQGLKGGDPIQGKSGTAEGGDPIDGKPK